MAIGLAPSAPLDTAPRREDRSAAFGARTPHDVDDGSAGAAARDKVDGIALVSEAALKRAIAALIDAEQVLAEASGIAALAALLEHQVPGVAGRRVVAVVSGGNIDAATLAEVLARG